MPTPILTGKAAVYGVTGTLAFAGAVVMSTAENKMLGADITDTFDIPELKDGVGNIIGLAAVNRRHEATFDIVPSDTDGSPTLADAKTAIKLPDPLAIVTIAGFGNTLIDGTWNYIGGGKITFSPDGYIKMSLPCRRVGDTPAALQTIG
jgi:hypothetical protein